jgi:regulator of nucleoside diphosphate kinase
MPDLVAALTDELERAEILPHGYPSEDTVRMGSEVDFRDDTSGKVQTVTLVFPGQADIAQRKISVLTPVGTALIGMRAGDSITFEARDGELRQLTVLNECGSDMLDNGRARPDLVEHETKTPQRRTQGENTAPYTQCQPLLSPLKR